MLVPQTIHLSDSWDVLPSFACLGFPMHVKAFDDRRISFPLCTVLRTSSHARGISQSVVSGPGLLMWVRAGINESLRGRAWIYPLWTCSAGTIQCRDLSQTSRFGNGMLHKSAISIELVSMHPPCSLTPMNWNVGMKDSCFALKNKQGVPHSVTGHEP